MLAGVGHSGLIKIITRTVWWRLIRDRYRPQKLVLYIKRPNKADLNVEERRVRGKVVVVP